MSYAYAGRYYPDVALLPLESTAYVPVVPAALPGVRQVPPGLEVGPWQTVWVVVVAEGDAPRFAVYLDWSATGWYLGEYVEAPAPSLTVEGAGLFRIEPFTPAAHFLCLRCVGLGGNGLNTKITAVIGGE